MLCATVVISKATETLTLPKNRKHHSKCSARTLVRQYNVTDSMQKRLIDQLSNQHYYHEGSVTCGVKKLCKFKLHLSAR